jgi:hypothetical protein
MATKLRIFDVESSREIKHAPLKEKQMSKDMKVKKLSDNARGIYQTLELFARALEKMFKVIERQQRDLEVLYKRVLRIQEYFEGNNRTTKFWSAKDSLEKSNKK